MIKGLTAVVLFMLCASCYAQDDKFDFIEKTQPAPGAGRRNELAELRQQVKDQEEEIARLEKLVRAKESRVFELERIPALFIDGLKDIKAEERPVRILIRSNDSCRPCINLINGVKSQLQNYSSGEDESNHFQIVKLSQKEWEDSKLNLPFVTLLVRGEESAPITERNPIQLANLLNRAIEADKATPAATVQENQAPGLTIGTIPAGDQIRDMLTTLEPMLDGGTLTITYTPRTGVIKEFLTIKRGSVGIKIPPKTTLVLGMRQGDMSIKLIDPKPQIVIGPFTRGVQEVDITPNKLSIRLPWMIDPELKY